MVVDKKSRYIYVAIQSTLNFVQNLLSSHVVPKCVKIKICRTVVVILKWGGGGVNLVYYPGRLCFKNEVPSEVFEPKTEELIQGKGNNVMNRSIPRTPHHVLLGSSHQRDM
jgi:hypothetical protein